MNKLFVICAIALTLTLSSVTSYGAIDGITAENYADYEKPISDAYGYNKGECEKEYMEGEEQFYNEYYDHWNVEKVYDESIVKEEASAIEEEVAPIEEPQKVEQAPQKPKAKSNKAIAKEWAKAHGGGFKIRKLVTISKGGKRGRVKGTKRIVHYPKKVKSGKRVTCYMIEKNGDVCAMVCLGKVK